MVRLSDPPDRPLVVYALASMGMGHAVRAEPVLDWLSRCADVVVLAGGAAYRHLRARQAEIEEIHSARYFYFRNRVLIAPIYGYVAATLPQLARSFVRVRRLLRGREPALLISDFEPISVYAALSLGGRVPVLSMSNMAMFYYADPSGFSGPVHRAKLAVLRAQYRGIVPRAGRTLVTSFARPDSLPEKARWAPPPVRAAVCARRGRARTSGPAVMYVGKRAEKRAHRAILASGVPFVVYGAAREEVRDDIRYRPFSGESFLDDLSAARFVVNTAGHSSIVDALALGKRVLAYPAAGHLEQQINAREVERLGFGRTTQALSGAELRSFAESCQGSAPVTAAVPDNAAFFAALAAAMEELGVDLGATRAEVAA